jgi:hypothetical protein
VSGGGDADDVILVGLFNLTTTATVLPQRRNRGCWMSAEVRTELPQTEKHHKHGGVLLEDCGGLDTG